MSYMRILATLFISAIFLLPTTTHAFTISKTVTTNNLGLVGYWTMDGRDLTTAALIDRSGNGNGGRLVNIATSTSRAEGKIGQALNFDGVNDRVDVSSNPSLEGFSTITISAWIYPTEDASVNVNGGRIVSKSNGTSGDDYALTYGSVNDEKLRFRVTTGATVNADSSSATAIELNKWQHVVGVYNGVTMELYVDGFPIGLVSTPTNQSGTIADSNDDLSIGGHAEGETDREFPGYIDDVRIYNRALSVTEIKGLYNIGATKFGTSNNKLNSGLIGHWTFDGKDMTTGAVVDKSGNGNGAILVNSATSTSRTEGKIGQAIKLDGVDDYVEMGRLQSTEGAAQLTWSFWAYPHVLQNADIFLSKGSIFSDASWQINMTTGGGCTNGNQILVYIPTTADDGGTYGCAAAGSIAANQWTHYAVVFDGGATGNSNRLKIYMNGVASTLDYGGTIPASIVTSSSNARVGRNSGSSGIYEGVIDDLRIYSRALSAEEAKAVFNSGASTKIGGSLTNTGSGSGLVGHWTFDGKDMLTGAVIDKSGNGNGGSLINMATSTSRKEGKIGQAIIFDGVDDYIVTPTVSLLTVQSTPFSAFAWVYPTNTTPTQGIWSTGQFNDSNWDMGVGISSGNLVLLGNGTNGPNDSGLAVPLNQWSFVGIVNTGTQTVFYVNNSSAAVANTSVNLVGSDPYLIGATARNSTVEGFFNGLIDDVRVYNRALSTNEVTRVYSMGR
jgi:hypothetical protein